MNLEKYYFILHKYKIKLKMHATSNFAIPHKSEIYIYRELKPEHTMSVVLHEIAHVLSYRRKKYWDLYKNNGQVCWTYLEHFKKMGLEMEKFTDAYGKELAERYFPGEPFYSLYSTPKGEEFFNQTLKQITNRLKEAQNEAA